MPRITMKQPLEFVLGSPIGLRCAAMLGRKWPKTRFVRSLCWHAGAGAWRPQQRVTAKMRPGFELVIDMTDHTFRDLYFHGEYQPDVTRVIEQLAEPGQVWLDIGANVGYFSMLLSNLLGDSGKVIAFEPNPLTRGFLELSIKRNRRKNIQVYSCALGANEAVSELYLPKNPDGVLGGHGRPSLIQQGDIDEAVALKVEIRSLDSILSETKVWGVKMDVEGYEPEVLKGAQNLFATNPPSVILSEVTHLPDVLMKPDDLVRSIVGLGYKAFHAETLEKWNPALCIDGSWSSDFIFIHQSEEEELAPKVLASRGRSGYSSGHSSFVAK